MSIEMPESLKKFGGFFGKGIIAQMAPQIAQGALVELLKAKNVDIKKATQWVESNNELWGELEPEHQEKLKLLAHRTGRVDFMNVDWAIDAMRKELPALASLFLGWKKANNWLSRQIEIMKNEIMKD